MNLTENFDLSAHNTMGLLSVARFGAAIAHADEIPVLFERAQATGLPLHVLGGGSNCLLRAEIDAVVAIMATQGKTIHEDGGVHLVTAQAGEDWPSLVEWTVERGLAGLENLAGIPGTVGAAPVQNIGAYGVELDQRLHALTAYDTIERRFRIFRPAECGFAYRTSLFKQAAGRYIIADVTFALSAEWRPVLHYPGLADTPGLSDARSVMERVLALRTAKLPDWRVLGNAGSFFHNPVVPAALARSIRDAPGHEQPDGRVKLSAAWLIDTCGFKGHRRGAAGVYDKHALILVNHGGATHEDIAELSREITQAVRTRFGVDLVREPVEV